MAIPGVSIAFWATALIMIINKKSYIYLFVLNGPKHLCSVYKRTIMTIYFLIKK